MKKLFPMMTLVWVSLWATAQENPLWLRYPSISPDGTAIAFTYKGDIYTVPTAGGRATQITMHAAYDTHPIWSPDSRRIAFASDREGSLDIYVVDREGGRPVRLTTHSGSEEPIAFCDAGHLLFSADIMPSAESVLFPSNGQFKQVYKVSVEGGRPVLFSSMPMESVSINREGVILYQDKKGYEDYWRKHQQSPIARDIWMYAPRQTPAYSRQTSFVGEDREPVWAPDGKSFYYLSEEKGSFNIFHRIPGSSSATQITRHTEQPVRFLSIAGNGMLCYGFGGEIYTCSSKGKSQKVPVRIVSDDSDKDVIRMIERNGASEMAVSPDGKEVAFIVHGDVYVTSMEYNTTRQVTDTPCQERGVGFAPDGRSVVYASERDGLWQLYVSTIVRPEEKHFAYATELKEERLTNSKKTSFQPQYSPDGKEVAFLEERTAIKVINLKDRKVRTVMDGKFQYSYSDGDQWFQWSPDSKWILSEYIGVGGWNNKDIVLLDASGKGQMVNLTESGYSDGRAKWALGGKAMIWNSDRAGYRSHGSWGAESDTYIMFFDAEAYDRFLMNKEELTLAEEQEKAEKEKAEKEKKEKAEKEKTGKKKEDAKTKKEDGKDKQSGTESKIKPLEFDLENRFDRIVRLTVNSSHMGDAVLTPKGDALYYLAAFEGGQDLWKHDLKEHSTRILLKGAGDGRLHIDKDGKNIYLCSHSGMKKIEAAGGKSTPVSFEAFFNYRPVEEREYIFDHAWRQVDDKFYVADMQGTDWKRCRELYKRYLPYISNDFDFAEMLSEMLGELNASHTGARCRASAPLLPTAALGVFYDEEYKGDGLRIKEIVAQSPLTKKKTEVKEGCVIEKIDGKDIKAGADYFPLLEGKAGRKVVLSVYNPESRKRFEETIKPISQNEQTELLYRRWVERCRKTVEELSGGRIGYVHIKGMDSPSFRKMYSELLGRNRQKEAVIVDVRHNGGGWLHDDVVTLLGGKEYQRFVPRGQYIGSDPFNKWLKPSCMLVCEDNYSNAHGTPFVYKTLGLGKLIGAPVAGTMTAVWWERQINPKLVFGIPQVGCQDMQGNYLENKTLYPDIEVYNSPEEALEGEDRQLEAAVTHLLQVISANQAD